MVLEKMLKPAKWIDEQILRQYTKLTKKWEDKGRSKYDLAQICNAPTWIPFLFAREGIYTGYISCMLRGSDFVDNLIGKLKGKHDTGVEENGDSHIITHPFSYFMDRLGKVARGPLFIAGVSLLAKSGLDLYNHFSNGEPLDEDWARSLAMGASFLGLSSSIYIKDSNPKLLDKAPFWKTAYDWAKDKLKSLAPQPKLQPVRVQAYQSLENYVEPENLS